MKIAYLGKTQLSDVDMSYLCSAQKKTDIDFFLEITPRYLKGAAINLEKCYPKCGIFKAIDVYPQFERYSKVINLDKCYVVNTPGQLWLLKGVWTNILFCIFLIKKKYDIIHITWPLNIHEFPLFLLKKKMLLTVHDPFCHTGSGNFVELARRYFSFHLIKRFIILNKAQKKEFSCFQKIPMERIWTSRLGCYNYLNYIEPTKIKNLPEKYILFFGSISQYKGLDYLFPAMVRCHETHPDYHLVVCGKGNYHFDISPYKNLKYFHIYNRFIKDEELVMFIKHSSFVICPYTDATQSGVIMSAYAFKKPVIVTNVGGLPEMVNNGELGLIVQEKSEDALAEAIIYYIEHPELRKTHALKIAETYFVGKKSWNVISHELNKIYQDMSSN